MVDKIRREKVLSTRRRVLEVLADSKITVEEGGAAILHVVSMGMAASHVLKKTFELEPNVHVTVSIDLTGGKHNG